jgi:hypothetical protein
MFFQKFAKLKFLERLNKKSLKNNKIKPNLGNFLL